MKDMVTAFLLVRQAQPFLCAGRPCRWRREDRAIAQKLTYVGLIKIQIIEYK
jgi:hypothetical protein